MSNTEGENQSSVKRVYIRHSTHQITKLEEIFKRVKNPSENLRREIAQELGLEEKQVNNWFKNKRVQVKNENEKVIHHAQNEKLLKENKELKEALKDFVHSKSCKDLKIENELLKQRFEMLSKFIARQIEKEKLSLELRLGPPTPPSYEDIQKLLNGEISSSNLIIGSSSKNPIVLDEDVISIEQPANVEEICKERMLEIGIAAKEEVIKLICTNEPFWVESQVPQRLVLHQQNYEDVFPMVDHFNGNRKRVESSKDSQIVRAEAKILLDTFLDSEKWENIFSTIVSKAGTIKVLKRGSSETRSGTLLLMHAEMHVPSPLVPTREFYFIRYCEQIEDNIWVIADVSYDYLKMDGIHSSTWKFPSGCLIHRISDRSSQVSWIEHVEVAMDAKTKSHRIYTEEIVNIAFGAKRWLMELQRMGERCFSAVTQNGEGRRYLMRLAREMVKEFSRIVTLASKSTLPHYIDDAEDSGVRFSIKRNTSQTFSNDPFIVIVASSILLPLSSNVLFEFLKDPTRRNEWDIVCHENPWHEVAHLSTGTNPNNYVSIIQTVVPPPKDGVITIQECFTDPLGSYVVFSSINIPELNAAVNNPNFSKVSMLPSGFLISETKIVSEEEGMKRKIRGSLLTVALQLFMPGPEIVNFESAAEASNALVNRLVKGIQDALIGSGVN